MFPCTLPLTSSSDTVLHKHSQLTFEWPSLLKVSKIRVIRYKKLKCTTLWFIYLFIFTNWPLSCKHHRHRDNLPAPPELPSLHVLAVMMSPDMMTFLNSLILDVLPIMDVYWCKYTPLYLASSDQYFAVRFIQVDVGANDLFLPSSCCTLWCGYTIIYLSLLL